MMRLNFLLFFVFSFFRFGFSQVSSYNFYDEIPVYSSSNDSLFLAYAGGLNSPEFSNIDLNQDGIQDIFIFDRHTYEIKCFIVNPTGSLTPYTYQKAYEAWFPEGLESFALLRDFNCDGYPDIFTRTIGGIKVYKNDGTHHFTLEKGLLLSDYGNIQTNLYNSNVDLPAIDDIDFDGDLDILAYDIGYNQLTYHKNASMERYGHCDSLEYVVSTRCWGEFLEALNNNDITLNEPCDALNNGLDSLKSSAAHAGSSILTLDYDLDYDKDLILGDVSFYNAVFLRNGGDSNNAVMDTFYVNFPQDGFMDTPAVHIFFPAGFYVDADNDNKKDLIFASHSFDNYDNTHSAWFYKNTQQTDSLDLTFIQENFLQAHMIDAGEGAYPVFYDFNKDGLDDIVIGTDGYFDVSSGWTSKLLLLENIGQLHSPAFKIVSNDFANLSVLNIDGVYPTFGDLDGDGDQDMMVGDKTGRIHYFEDISSGQNAANFQLVSQNYASIDVGDYAKPQLFDFNDDGALDLLIGERDGGVFYFENSGTAQQAIFSDTAITDMLGGIDVKPGVCCLGNSAVFMTRDSIGEKVLFVASDQGYIYIYTDIVDPYTPFTKLDSMPSTSSTGISGSSLFGLPNDVLAIGDGLGGIQIYKSTDTLLTSAMIKGQEKEAHGIQIFPNPAKEKVVVQFNDIKSSWVLTIYDLRSRKIASHTLINHKTELDFSRYKSGTYTFVFESTDTKWIKKVVKE